MYRIIFYLLLLILPAGVFAQQQNLKFEIIGTDMGLSQSNVMSLHQDSRGFLWFGTRDGLNRYDGYKIIVYKYDFNNPRSLSDNTIHDIAEDNEGNLWIATSKGLNKFDRFKESFERFTTDKHNPNTIASNLVNCVTFDKHGFLWLGFEGSGFDKFDLSTRRFEHYVHNPNNSNSLSGNIVKQIFPDKTGRLWIATDGNGVSVYDTTQNKFTAHRFDANDQSSLSHDRVADIFQDSRQRIWIGTMGSGLNRFDESSGRFIRYNACQSTGCPPKYIRAVREDAANNIWVGTENDGLWYVDEEGKDMNLFVPDYTNSTNLNNNSIWSLLRDSKGNMWVGTFSGGVHFFNRDKDKFLHYQRNASKQSLSHNNVLTIIEDHNAVLWVGTDGGGLNRFDRATGIFTHFLHDPNNKNSLCGNNVISVIETRDKKFWIGTWGEGISVYDPLTKKFTNYRNDPDDPRSLKSNNVWVLFQDSDGDIWAGTYYGGLEKFDNATKTFIHYQTEKNSDNDFSESMINEIYEDSKRNLWIGTNGGGLILFDKKSGKKLKTYVHHDSINSISNNVIYCVTEDSVGDLWIATASGLTLFDPIAERFTCYYRKDGLPNESIFGILEDSKRRLWLSTNKGISCYDRKSDTFKNYSIADGLQADEFKQGHLKTKDGKMYFGGIRGFNEFRPEDVREFMFDPPLVLTDFLISNRTVPITESDDVGSLHKAITETSEIVLGPDHTVFSLEFASLNFTSREKKQYAYILENFDRDWHYSGTKRVATYTNLDPGRYTFKVKGMNNGGGWSEKTIALNITVLPPYWKTWWFRLVVTLITFGVVLAIYRYRINAIEKQKLELERLVKERTEKLAISSQQERIAREEAERARLEAEQANKAKSIFLATMSHEIRTPMNGVIGMATLMSHTKLDDEQRDYLNTIKTSGENLLSVINDILDFSKIESGKMDLETKDFDLRTCIEEVFDLFATKAAETGLDLIYQIDYNVPAQIVGDSLRLKQILINLVGNAVKFTHKGEVYVGVHVHEHQGDSLSLRFEVRDTGIGIAKDKVQRLFKSFSQVDSSTTRKYGGTGLGLAICEKLVKLMKGSISVESEEGQGTLFSFTIQTKASVKSIRTYVYNNLSGLEDKSILVVDDNAANRLILKSQLELWKFKPTLAASGFEALNLLRSQRFDLMITDMDMPEQSGLELAARIKETHPSLPMILLTSVGNERMHNNGDLFSSVLTKPVKHNILCNHIINELKEQRTQQKNKEIVVQPDDIATEYPLEILIVDDNPINQKLSGRILSKMGYHPDTAENGVVALEKLSVKQYDLILMDVQMPELDGLEATKIIRANHQVQPIIIAMTANAMEDDKQECLNSGMNDYLSKPIKMDAMIAMVEKWASHIQRKQV